MTQDLLDAIDSAIDVVAARFDHVLDLLSAEHDRLEQLAAMRATAEQLTTPSSPETRIAAEPAERPRLDEDDSAAHAAVRSTDAASAPPVDEQHDPPPAPRTAPRGAGEGRDGLTEKQSAILSAVNSLGECGVSDVAARVGREDAPDAVRSVLVTLRERGLIGHNGKSARAGRYLRLGGGKPDDHPSRRQGQRVTPPIAPTAGLNGSIEQRVELALKWAKNPLTLDAIVGRCKATGERSRVQEALAYMEADGRAVCTDDRWARPALVQKLAEAA